MVARARRTEPAAATERFGEPAGQGLSVGAAAAASSIAFRPMRRRPRAPDSLTGDHEADWIAAGAAPRPHGSG